MEQRYDRFKVQWSQICQYYKSNEMIILVPLVMLMFSKLMWHLYRVLSAGKGLPYSDDSAWYLNYASAFFANIRDGIDMNDALYFGYNLLLAILLSVFDNPLAIVVIQIVIASLSLILIYKISALLFTRVTAIIASVFYSFTYEVALWSQYILSDSFFVSLLLLCVYFLLKALEPGGNKYQKLFVLASLYLLVFRPTGILCLAFMAVYIVIRTPSQSAALVRRYRYVIGGAVIAFTSVAFYLYSSHALDPLIESIQFNAKKVLYNVYAKGWIYDKPTAYDYFFRPNYTIDIGNSLVASFIVNNWDHVSILYGRRAVAFLGTWVWQADFTTLKGLISVANHLLPLALFLIGTIGAIRNGLLRKASILWLIIAAVFIFCVFLFIDAMYRYRFPALPFIAIIAAYGTEIVVANGLDGAKKMTEMVLYGERKTPNRNTGF